MTAAPWRRIGLIVLKLAITVTCLYLVSRRIDFSAVGEDFSRLKWAWVSLTVAQVLAIPILGGLRWRVAMRALGSRLPYQAVIRLFWIGMAFSQVLPSASGGDAVRVLFLRRYGESWRVAALSVMVERAAMVASLLACVALLSSAMPAEPTLPHLSGLLWLMALGAAIGLGLLLAADRVLAQLPPWKVLHFLAHLSHAARSTLKGRAGLELVILCLVTHLNMAFAYLWLAHALQLPLSPAQCFFYASLTTLISALPLSIGGWGVREGVLVTLFGAAGITSHGALAFSVSLGILVAAVGGVGILGLWLGAPRRTGSAFGWTTRS